MAWWPCFVFVNLPKHCKTMLVGGFRSFFPASFLPNSKSWTLRYKRPQCLRPHLYSGRRRRRRRPLRRRRRSREAERCYPDLPTFPQVMSAALTNTHTRVVYLVLHTRGRRRTIASGTDEGHRSKRIIFSVRFSASESANAMSCCTEADRASTLLA